MTIESIYIINNSLNLGSGVIKNWYSPQRITGAQKSILKRLGINFEQRYRSKN